MTIIGRLKSTAAGFGLLAALASTAIAQEVPQSISIPSQPLGTALAELALATNVEILFGAGEVAGVTSSDLEGDYTVDQALATLLAGTGLVADFIDSDTITLAAASPINGSEEGLTVLDQIIVRGELQTRSLQETQSSVAVFTGDELDASTDSEIADVFERTANVTDSVGGLGFTIRGIESRGVGGGGVAGVIDVNVDGASYVSTQATYTGALSTWDLDQVEIFRGPQSTQQGRNALAGAIRIRSADPVFDYEAKGRFDYASFNENREAIAVNAPIIDDVLAVRFSAERFATDGFITNLTLNTDDFTPRERGTIRGKIRFQPTDDIDIILGHTYSDNEIGTANIDESVVGTRPKTLDIFQDFEGAINNSTNLRATWDLAPQFSLSSETTYLNTDYIIVADGGIREIEDRSLAQEVRLSYEGERLSGVVGGFFTDFSSDLVFNAAIQSSDFPTAGFPPGVLITIGNGNDTETRNFALYGEAEYEVIDGLTLIGGLRYDYEEQDIVLSSSLALDPPLFAFPPTPDTELSADYSAFLPKAGLVYDWTEDISTGFTFQRGYRAGGAGVSASGTLFEFDPEFTNNYELSFRSQWFDDQLTLNANAFFTQWTDQQVFVAAPGLPFDGTVENSGRSRLWGFELEGDWQAAPGLDLFGNVGYTKTEFVEFVSGGDDFAGNEFPFAPRWTATVGGSWNFFDDFVATASGSYTGASFNDAQNTPGTRSDNYFIINGQIGYEAEHWSAALFARNLLNAKYIENRRLDSFDRIGESRVVGAILTARF